MARTDPSPSRRGTAAPASSRRAASGRSTDGGRARAKKPVWKEVEEQEDRRLANRVRSGGRSRSRRFERRYVAPYDLEGPKVRLGVAWFTVALVALIAGPLPTAVAYGAVAAAAGAQAARAWRRRRGRAERPNELLATGIAGAMGLGATLGAGGTGVVMVAGAVLAYASATGDRRSPNPAIADAGLTVQCAVPPGLVAMSMVLLARLDQGSAIALLLLVSAYEVGDFLVGSGAHNPYEGPAAGAAAIVVVTFIVSTLPVSALGFGEAWLFGGLVAVGAPAGHLVASALLPSAAAPATALRRLDALLLVAPLWAWGVGLVM